MRLGVAERVNTASTPSSPTVPVIERPRIDLALAQHVERVAELERRVGQHEAQVDLLVDRQRRGEPVGTRRRRRPDDAGEQRRALDDALDHARRADALEDDRVLGPRAERLTEPPGVPPADRQAFELLASCPPPARTRPVALEVVVSVGGRAGQVAPGRRAVGSARPGQSTAAGEKSAATTVWTPSFSRGSPRVRPVRIRLRSRPALPHLAAPHGVPGNRHRLGQCRDIPG